MQYIKRLADSATAARYPLPVDDEDPWQIAESGAWELELVLPAVPAGHIIVPSLALLDVGESDAAWLATLHHEFEYPLQSVPATTAAPALPNEAKAASRHIDCWHSEQALESSRCVFTVRGGARPQAYLATLSIRPLEIQTPYLAPVDIEVDVPTTLSQHEANDEIRRRICSPTAVAMALSAYPNAPVWDDTITACYDAATRAYGVWPLAIRWSAMQGIVAAVEVFQDWQAPMACLSAGVPLVCSIDYDSGKLKHAPMARTGGHLVVVYGVEGNEVLVKDPAGANRDEVIRRYDCSEFGDAWLRRRGAAYVFARPHGSATG